MDKQRIERLTQLARTSPDALAPEAWQALAAAGVDTKALAQGGFGPAFPGGADAPAGFDTTGALMHPSGLLVHGPGSTEIIRAAQGSKVNSAAYALMRSYCDAYLEASLRVYRGPWQDVENSEALPDHPANPLLQRRVNPWMTVGSFRWAMRWALAADGNYYGVKVRGGGGSVLDNTQGQVEYIWPVPPHEMQPARRKGSSEAITHYAWDLGKGKPLEVPVENVIHWRHGADPMNPLMGLGALKMVAREIMTDTEAEGFVYYLMKNSGVPGLIFTPPTGGKPLSKTTVESIKESVQARTGGSHRGDVFVAPESATVAQFQFNPQGLDLTHVWHHVESRLAAVLGWPAVLAGLHVGLSDANRSTVEGLRDYATETVLMGAWAADGQTWDDGLRDAFGLGADEYIAHDWTSVRALQGDREQHRRWVLDAWDKGLLTIEQAHATLDMDLPPGVDPSLRKPELDALAGMGGIMTASSSRPVAGKALPVLEAKDELDDAAEVTEADVDDAIRAWDMWAQENAPEFVGMLGTVDGES